MTAARQVCRSDAEIEEATGHQTIDVVTMVQGDEPLVTPDMVDVACGALIDNPDCGVACLAGEIDTLDNFKDPNEVKVVVNNRCAMSREPILTPSRVEKMSAWKKQVRIIPFTRSYLLEFNAQSSSPHLPLKLLSPSISIAVSKRPSSGNGRQSWQPSASTRQKISWRWQPKRSQKTHCCQPTETRRHPRQRLDEAQYESRITHISLSGGIKGSHGSCLPCPPYREDGSDRLSPIWRSLLFARENQRLIADFVDQRRDG